MWIRVGGEMGKAEKKRSVVDRVGRSSAHAHIKSNPFEVKINRKKFEVLGRRSKHEVGLPGVSRSKSDLKRKKTLLKEFRQKHKSNSFVDRRFGEYDTQMDPEEKILKRFAMERQRAQSRKDMFNLNDEEELTHFGKSLAEMETLVDGVDSESDSEEKGLLSAELTASHFGGGGGLLRKKSGDEEQDKKCKSRQELLEELIIKSKQEKRARQSQKDETQELTDKLDQDWRSIHNLLHHKKPTGQHPEETDQRRLDDYDVMVRELGFEMKAQPSEKLKTPEEIAKEEKERLHKLEEDRRRRMEGEVNETPTQTHLSADDLNDGFILNTDDQKTLSYQDGRLNVEEDKEDSTGEQDADEDENEDDDDDADEDDHSDLEDDDDGDDDDGETRCTLGVEQRKEIHNAAQDELPYTFSVPECYADLKLMLENRSADQQRLILDRTRKCNHPSLAVGNKSKLQKLFGFLLEYVGDLATHNPPQLTTVDALIPQIYSLTQLFPEAASKAVQSLLRDRAFTLEQHVEVKGRAPVPRLDMLIYLKIITLLFPASDFRHPVTTPALLYISQVLTKCVVVSLESVCAGLILCCVAVDCVSLSQRYFPELLNFLLGILHLAVPSHTNTDYQLVPPFRLHSKCSDLLVVSDADAALCWTRRPIPLTSVLNITQQERDHYRLSVLYTCLDLVKRCTQLYQQLPAYHHIFQPIRILLADHLPVADYPAALQELHKEILESIPETASQHAPLLFDKKKPVPLKQLRPKLVEVLDYGKRRGNTQKEKERERLKHKYKKEMKGALREIRKDSRFLSRTKLNDTLQRDAERKRKVKELYGSLASQEGEWKALKKRKRK